VAIARRKLGFSWEEVLESIAAIRVVCTQQYGYAIFDAMLIAAALDAGSSTLYTPGTRVQP